MTPWLLLAIAPAIGLMLLGAIADTLNALWWEIQIGCAVALNDADSRLRLRGP